MIYYILYMIYYLIYNYILYIIYYILYIIYYIYYVDLDPFSIYTVISNLETHQMLVLMNPKNHRLDLSKTQEA